MQQRPAGLQTLEVATDYYPALLWLMGELEQARTSDVIAEFERRLGDLIPSEHREMNKSGYVRWESYVRWGRQALVNAGLMGSGGWGVWTITEAGRKWLQDHPDSDRGELVGLVRKSQATSRKQPRPVPEVKQQPIKLDGETLVLSQANVLEEVRKATADGVPPEAKRFRNWYLTVDGERLSVKWVVSLVTGIPTQRFKTGQARRQLRNLGLEAQSLARAKKSPAAVDEVPSSPVELTREAFYQAVLARLEGKLPACIYNRNVNPNSNTLRLNHPAPRTCYELVLYKTYTFLGLTFFGSEAENRARLVPFQQALPDLGTKLGASIQTRVGGKSYSVVYLKLPPAKLDRTTAHQIADTWLQFIEATLPLLDQVVAELGLMVSGPRPKDEDLKRPKAILSRKIRKIRAYLDGDRSLSPSDETLCEWVQFCYTFELFKEGAALFRLVRADTVSSWLYERTRKLARACELHTSVGR